MTGEANTAARAASSRRHDQAESAGPRRSGADFHPRISTTPSLPIIDWTRIDADAPKLLPTPDDLPEADAVVITWAAVEWGPLQHVFVSSDREMPYSVHRRWQCGYDGWVKYERDLLPYHDASWKYWCWYRLVGMHGRKVLLIASNTHLVWPGKRYVERMIELVVERARPDLLLSIGTAGGARIHDRIGTVNTVNAATLYDEGRSGWPTYRSAWRADRRIVERDGFSDLLFPIPTTPEDLASLRDQFNDYFGTDHTLDELNPHDLNRADPTPRLNDMTQEGTPLLTTPTFVVGTTDGKYEAYACIEMDDALVAKVCYEHDVPFGFVRNLSDPVQNAKLDYCDQKSWGSTFYEVYGLYTSYNGALNTWAWLEGEWTRTRRQRLDGA